MPYLFMMCGPSGIGKSHLIQTADLKPFVSRDTIRFSMLKEDDDYFKYENFVVKLYQHNLAMFLVNKMNVIADSTNLNPTKRHELMTGICNECDNLMPSSALRGLIKFVAIDCVPKDMNVDEMIRICKEHNATRTGRAYVPEDQIEKMCKMYVRPNAEEEKYLYEVISIEDLDKI